MLARKVYESIAERETKGEAAEAEKRATRTQVSESDKLARLRPRLLFCLTTSGFRPLVYGGVGRSLSSSRSSRRMGNSLTFVLRSARPRPLRDSPARMPRVAVP